MKSKFIFSLSLLFASALPGFSQVLGVNGEVIDTTNIYGERKDSLKAAVFTARQKGAYIPKGKDLKVEVISAAGLCKMACCNLAESFENSASVTVGYSDAVTGARQIRLLGLSGIYTQMLDENRPVMRGLAAPFGLSYVPGQWLESIQIAKGVSSVINGVEALTGQINMEHRKPTDEKPFFLNYSAMNDTKMDLNIASSLQLNDNWSTVILGHVSGNLMSMDDNGDTFMDDPRSLQFNLSNRWLYYALSGVQVRFGVRAIRDSRLGGQVFHKDGRMVYYDKDSYNILTPAGENNPWGSNILNQSIDGYLKVGIPLNEDNSQNVAFVADYNYQDMDSHFGATSYIAGQHSGFFNALYQNEVNESHKFTLGAGTMIDRYNECLDRTVIAGMTLQQGYNKPVTLASAGAFGEYTFHYDDVLSTIVGLRADWYNTVNKVMVSPRLTLKYTPHESIVFRANGGRGIRYSTPLIDNIGVFSTGKYFEGAYREHLLEDAWTLGANATYYFPGDLGAYLSFDYFRTVFAQQMILDYEAQPGTIFFAASNGSRNHSDNYQLDFSIEPVERFTVTTTFRYTDAWYTLPVLPGEGSDSRYVRKPMTGIYKGVLNLQYATRLNKWIFDFTASANGPCRLYDFMATDEWVAASQGQVKIKDGQAYSTVYPLLYFQVTKRFRGFDLYVGGENLTNFKQKNVVFGDKMYDGHVNPAANNFDASCIWGPLMGTKIYAGIRMTIWKTE